MACYIIYNEVSCSIIILSLLLICQYFYVNCSKYEYSSKEIINSIVIILEERPYIIFLYMGILLLVQWHHQQQLATTDNKHTV